MKALRLPTCWILLFAIPALAWSLPETADAASDQAAREKAFLASPEVAIAELVPCKIADLTYPKDKPSFIYRMERANKEDVKTAELTVAGRQFKIILGERLERDFYLYDVATANAPYWWGAWSAHSYHKIGDRFFQFMIVEDGTKIAGRVYQGPLGTIKVGKGDRDLEKVEFNGSVMQKDSVSAPIGVIEERWPESVGECQIPSGDYTAYFMHVTFANLAISISNNYHTDAQGRSRSDREVVYGMQVREDEPYVLDFSSKPVVVFDKPSKDQTSFSRGDQIQFASVLVDPKLDLMIRGLDDTSVMVDKEYKNSSGEVVQTVKVSKSLDPKVVITRADGEIVAEGVMPFG